MGVRMESVSRMFNTGRDTVCDFPNRSLSKLAITCLFFFFHPVAAHGAPLLPAGVEQPAPGVYASEDESGCCWLRPAARFTIARPPHADLVTLDFVIPPYAAGRKPTALTVSAGGRSQTVCCFGVGEHQATFHLPKRYRPHEELQFASSTQFVPAERGLNADRRVLTVLLKSAITVNSATGDVYVGMEPASSNLLLPRWRIVADAVCLVLAASLMLLLARRPKWMWISVLLSAPFLFPVPVYGTTISLEKIVIVLAAVALLLRKDFRTVALYGSGRWMLGALLLFIVDMALSSVGAHFHGAAIRETLKAAEYAAAFAIVYGAYLVDPDEAALQSTLIALTCIVSFLAFAQPFAEPVQRTLVSGHIVARIAGPLEGPNQLSAFLGILLVALIALAKRFTEPLALALGLGIVALALTFSRGGIAAFVFGAAVAVALRVWPQRKIAVAATAAVICGGLLVLTIVAALKFPDPALDRIFGSSDAFNGGLGSRTALWHAAVLLWRMHPVLGVGPGNYELLVGALLPGVRTHANGYFFQILAEQGVAGVVLLLALVIVPAAIFIRNANNRFGIAGFAVVAALGFHQLLDGLLLYPKVGIEYWGCIAIAAAALSAVPIQKTVL